MFELSHFWKVFSHGLHLKLGSGDILVAGIAWTIKTSSYMKENFELFINASYRTRSGIQK